MIILNFSVIVDLPTCTYMYVYCIAGNFRGRNFCEFRCFVLISKSFPGDCLKALWTEGGMSKQSSKVLSMKSSLSTDLRKFSPLYYMVVVSGCYIFVLL